MTRNELLRKQFLTENNITTKYMSDRSMSAQQKIEERLKKNPEGKTTIHFRITNEKYNKLFHLAHYKQLHGDHKASISSVINYAIKQFLKVMEE